MIGHTPVLYQECMDALKPERGGVFVDGTLGGAGHSMGLLKGGNIRLIGIDKDEDAIIRCSEFLAEYKDRVTFVRDDYKNIKVILSDNDIDGIDGALLDLGVSSFQIDTAERGFSYSEDAPLDMRMDKSSPLSAFDVVNGYEKDKLKKIISEYGEEKFAAQITNAIIKNRPIYTTGRLSEVIKAAIPAPARRTGGNPSKRTFQAIRIEVNSEIQGLEDAIFSFIEVLKPKGRLAVISFHSLEDRAVKQAFKRAENPCTCPPDFPVCVCGKKPLGKQITHKPIIPNDSEKNNNKRAHSAKLRIFEKGELL